MNQVKTGKFIAELRRENHMTQELLGEKIGVTNKTISRWENGNYMPNVEMLQMLSNLFHISINELICGEKLNDSSFRQEADRNLLALLKNEYFSVKERSDFWKKKWMKEHVALITISSVTAIIVFVAAWLGSVYWLMGICPMGWLILYAFLRNRMMIYIERRIFTMQSEPNNNTAYTLFFACNKS